MEAFLGFVKMQVKCPLYVLLLGVVFVMPASIPADEPAIERTILFEEEKDGFRLYRIPGIVVTAKGTAWPTAKPGNSASPTVGRLRSTSAAARTAAGRGMLRGRSPTSGLDCREIPICRRTNSAKTWAGRTSRPSIIRWPLRHAMARSTSSTASSICVASICEATTMALPGAIRWRSRPRLKHISLNATGKRSRRGPAMGSIAKR